MRGKVRTILIALLGFFLAFVLLDSTGLFDSRSYFEVPHGSHTHYVPKECEPALPVSQSPTTRPREGEKVDCTGQIVRE